MLPPATWAVEADACPLCRSADAAVIGTQDRRGAPLRVVLCRGCGLARVSPRPAPEAYRAFYEQQYRREYKRARVPSPRRLRRHARIARERLEWIRQVAGPRRTILDAGCGGGETVLLLGKAGFDALGIEPDPALCEFARERLRAPVENRWVEDDGLPPGAFQVVCAFHVIEHALDPVLFLRKLREATEPGGRLLVETPNLGAPFPHPSRRWHKAHLFYFTASTLAQSARAAGWRVLSIATSGDGGNLRLCGEPAEAAPVLPDPARGEEALRLWLSAGTARRYYLAPAVWLRAIRRLANLGAELLGVYATAEPIDTGGIVPDREARLRLWR